MKKQLFISLLTGLMISRAFCIPYASVHFPGKNPGEAKHLIRDSVMMLYNESMEATWSIENRTIRLVKIKNRYDGKEIVFTGRPFFSIGLASGEVYSNEDFTLRQFVRVSDLAGTDSLPTPALRFAGKELSAELYAAKAGMTVVWSVELRNESNYVRQKIIVTTDQKPVSVAFVSFFDSPLNGAQYAGSVLGAPITCDNFFFGMENPVAQSKALINRMIGQLTSNPVDVSHIIQSAGEYIVAVEHGSEPDFDIESFQLKQNGKLIAEDQHILNGKNGSHLYRLAVNDYRKGDAYTLHADVQNEKNQAWMAYVYLYRKTDDVLNFYVVREDTLLPGKQISESLVMGVTPERQNRRAFQYYLDRERARPYKQFLHYNTWWDIPDYVSTFSFDADQLTERMEGWYRKFIQPYGVQFHSFVFDDGWDDLEHLWYIDPVKFPDGFAPHAKLCRAYDSGIGVWFSPFGGYNPRKAHRINTAQREGMELNVAGLSLAGPNYYKRFYERSADMIVNYKVNYFKYDGLGGSEPQYLPDMEAGTRLISDLRKINPDIYFNVTTGTWSSPFWLLFADCTWRGSFDLQQAGEGEDTQMFITYRDGTLHNNVVNRSPLYPLNSIMTVGIAYANHGAPNRFISDNEKGFKDMVRSYFASGSSLQELYISYDKMKDNFWPILAEAALWSKANEAVLVDTHWVGGSPINLEVYGFASWNGTKGILSLRNPSSQPLEYTVDLQQALALQPSENGTFLLKSPWKEDNGKPVKAIQSDCPETITLSPFELMVVEIVRDKTSSVVYQQSDELFPNPERGFHSHTSCRLGAQYGGLDENMLQSLRARNISLLGRSFYLHEFRDQPLSALAMAQIENEFEAMRKAGLKCILRFAYSGNETEPDAPLSIVLQHLDQLKPCFEKNMDVIALLQAGFIGAWGEMHSSSNNLDKPETMGVILDKMLEVLPDHRMIQVRTPRYKMEYVQRNTALTHDEAFSGSKVARVGHYNDCFLASPTDYGTYAAIETEKEYIHAEGLFLPVGGETCPPSGIEPADCEKAENEMRRLHWNYLNESYYRGVHERWIEQGCMDNIIRELGYRFVLHSAEYHNNISENGELKIKMKISNVGYGCLYNPRHIEFILKNTVTSDIYFAVAKDDPRYWTPLSMIEINTSLGIPPDMPAGDYELYLNLPDPAPSIHDNPDYSIRLANMDVWDSTTGYNNLLHRVKIGSKKPANPTCDAYFVKKLPLDMSVLVEEDVYTEPAPDNGANIIWCYGSTVLVRNDNDVYLTELAVDPAVKPLNNCYWKLLKRNAEGWNCIFSDDGNRTREPSPMVVFPNNDVFVSVNPILVSGPEVYYGPAQPQIVRFSIGNDTVAPRTLLPDWVGDPSFTDHSYRSFVADGKNRELILFQNIEYSHAEWSFYDRTGNFSAKGKIVWPWGSEYVNPVAVRICYPAVALVDRKVFFCGVSDITEPNPAWSAFKKELTGRAGYDFRRLFFTWTNDISKEEFQPWIEISSREETCGSIMPCDLYVAPDESVHLLWTETAIDTRLREKFFPDEKQSEALCHAVIRNGKIQKRSNIIICHENEVKPVASMGRFHSTPDGRLWVVYYVSGTEKNEETGTEIVVSENRISEIKNGKPSHEYQTIPLKIPFSTFFTASVRAGNAPSAILDLHGTCPNSNQVRYAAVRLF